MKKEEVYRSALKKWGNEKQLLQLSEEYSEVFIELNHFLREDKTVDLRHLACEFADLEIMIGQMKEMIESSIVGNAVSFQESVNEAKIIALECLEKKIKEVDTK